MEILLYKSKSRNCATSLTFYETSAPIQIFRPHTSWANCSMQLSQVWGVPSPDCMFQLRLWMFNRILIMALSWIHQIQYVYGSSSGEEQKYQEARCKINRFIYKWSRDWIHIWKGTMAGEYWVLKRRFNDWKCNPYNVQQVRFPGWPVDVREDPGTIEGTPGK